MKNRLSKTFRYATVLALFCFAATAQAHTGHGTSGFFEGLKHPLGWDHLLAMVAVGTWSVAALPAHRSWWGPMTFMATLVVSAAVGAADITFPYLESLISLSLVLFGVMLVMSRSPLPPVWGLSLIAVAASLHGLAHGSEAPEAGFYAYAIGFLITTAALHFGGVVAGLSVQRFFREQANTIVRMLGLMCGVAGLYLFSQIG